MNLPGLRNWKTTIAGAIGAVVIWYTGIGFAWPTTQEQKVAFWTGLASAVIGYFAKDASTGSQPK